MHQSNMKLSTALAVFSLASSTAAHTIFVQLIANGQTNRNLFFS
jgi:hypothetical protein